MIIVKNPNEVNKIGKKAHTRIEKKALDEESKRNEKHWLILRMECASSSKARFDRLYIHTSVISEQFFSLWHSFCTSLSNLLCVYDLYRVFDCDIKFRSIKQISIDCFIDHNYNHSAEQFWYSFDQKTVQ